MGWWLMYADRTTASRFPKIRGLHRDPSASARLSPSLRRVEALRSFFGISSIPLPRIVLVDINTAGPRFFFIACALRKESTTVRTLKAEGGRVARVYFPRIFSWNPVSPFCAERL